MNAVSKAAQLLSSKVKNRPKRPKSHYKEMARISGEARRARSPNYKHAERFLADAPPLSMSAYAAQKGLNRFPFIAAVKRLRGEAR